MTPGQGDDPKLTSGAAGVVAAVIVLAAAVLLFGLGLASPRAEPRGEEPGDAAPTSAASGVAPVVMVVFDEFPLTSLLDGRSRIDARRYPNIASLAGDSTWFANATGVHDRTTKAVPAILTGGLPRGGKLPVARDHRRSLFTLLRRSHEMNVSEEATALCPEPCGGSGREVARARSLREIELAIIRNIHRGRPERFAEWVGRIRAGGRPQLSFKHVFLPHTPFKYLPSGRNYLENWRERLPGLSEHRIHSPWLAGQANQRQLLNLAFTDRLIGLLIRRLRRVGLYDRSLIVLTADHGASFQRGQDRRIITRRTFSDIASIPLIVKRPHQQRGRVSRSYVRTPDILPTIAQGLGLKLPWRVQGRSAYGRGVRGRRRVFMFRGAEATVTRAGREPRVRLSVRAFERSQRRALRRQRRLFGSGDVNRIYRFGPYQRQLGRAVAELPVGSGGPVSANIKDAGLLRSVNLRGGFVPAQVVGRVNGPRRLGRPVAVAVNGRIAAVGHTFALPGGRREHFSMLVPDWMLRQGSNDVRVYSVSGSRARPRLALLGAS